MKRRIGFLAVVITCVAGAAPVEMEDFRDMNQRGNMCRDLRHPVAIPGGGPDLQSATGLFACVSGLKTDLDNVVPKFANDHETLKHVKEQVEENDEKLDDEVRDRLALEDRVDALEAKSGNGGKPDGGKGGADGVLAARIAALEAQVNALQSAVAALKAQNQGQKVRAPFQVVDAANQPLFTVAASGSGARVSVSAPSGQSAVELSTDKGGSVAVRDATGATRAQLGLETDGRYSLTLLTAQKQPVAKLSSAKDGGGGIIGVFDKAGAPRIFMEGSTPRLLVQDGGAQPMAVIGMDEGHGIVGILSNGNTLAGLGAYPNGAGGRLWLNDASGNWLFKAGKSESGGDACATGSKGVRCLATGLR